MRPVPPGFAQFWAAYPKKFKRIATEDAFVWAMRHYNQDGLLLQRMLDAIPWQLELVSAAAYMPDPDKWICGLRWTDERPAPPKPKPVRETPPTAGEIQAWRTWSYAVATLGHKMSLPDFVARQRQQRSA